jgi:crossover junction endodeoxyribonuclease RuvC
MICGVDPGKTGAVALLYPDGTVYIEDMPVLGKEINGPALAGTFTEFRPDHVYLEHVNSHLMGRQSAFNFGQGVGVIKGVLGALHIPYTLVTPAKWKGYFNLNRDKDASRLLATRLYPAGAKYFERKKDADRAEALLIAKYGSELNG